MNKMHLLIIFALINLLITNASVLSFQMYGEEKNIIVRQSTPQRNNDQNNLLNKYSSLLQPLHLDTLHPFFQPQNLTNGDDAYHESNQTYSTEWWYFDAKLNEEYSLQFSIHLYTIIGMGFATIQCNLYKKGMPLISERNIHSLKNMTFSKQKPHITLNKKTVMTTQQKNTVPDRYRLIFSGSNYSFNLTFNQLTEGWKGTTSAGDWAVVFPKAIVNGILTIENKSRSVRGTGYHDHNWNVTLSSGLNFGWLWGKTITNDYSITWANIYETWYKDAPLMIINEDGEGYRNIPSNQITITVTNVEWKNGLIIPKGFIISAQTKTCYVNLNIDAIQSDYTTVLGLINYWRYHIHTRGILQIDGRTEQIDEYNIAEFIRFRPY